MSKIASLAATLEAPSYVALRFASGLMFACHGLQKWPGWLTTKPTPEVGSQLWIGGIIELVTGVLIALGLATRPAAFLASGTMAVAYVQFHWKLELSQWQWLPLVNRGEMALVYALLFLYVFARGPGRWSVDAR